MLFNINLLENFPLKSKDVEKKVKKAAAHYFPGASKLIGLPREKSIIFHELDKDDAFNEDKLIFFLGTATSCVHTSSSAFTHTKSLSDSTLKMLADAGKLNRNSVWISRSFFL